MSEDRSQFLWGVLSLNGRCGHCNMVVDNYNPNHRVTSLMRGGKGVECVFRGDIDPKDGGPLLGSVHCFYGCEHVVRDRNPFEAHRHMEDHYEVAHRSELEDDLATGGVVENPEQFTVGNTQ